MEQHGRASRRDQRLLQAHGRPALSPPSSEQRCCLNQGADLVRGPLPCRLARPRARRAPRANPSAPRRLCLGWPTGGRSSCRSTRHLGSLQHTGARCRAWQACSRLIPRHFWSPSTFARAAPSAALSAGRSLQVRKIRVTSTPKSFLTSKVMSRPQIPSQVGHPGLPAASKSTQ